MLKSKYLVSELFCGSFPGCLRVYFLYTFFDFIKSLRSEERRVGKECQ